mmetsp:Transcript_146798/g.372540  ORF Transcript_146798/g.372540 Transcript_146798/m.372540 type:complete len:87 (+) Transcript_146798:2037-2297(+)
MPPQAAAGGGYRASSQPPPPAVPPPPSMVAPLPCSTDGTEGGADAADDGCAADASPPVTEAFVVADVAAGPAGKAARPPPAGPEER